MLQDCFDVSWVKLKKGGNFLSTAKDLLAQTCFWNLRESPSDLLEQHSEGPVRLNTAAVAQAAGLCGRFVALKYAEDLIY